jgi:hypothetical protein
MSCKVTLERLMSYRFGDLLPAEEEALEEHVFECADCAPRVSWLVSLDTAVRDAFARGELSFSASALTVAKAQSLGLKVRTYAIAPGGSVACTAAPEDDLLVTRLRIDVPNAQSLDLLSETTTLATGERHAGTRRDVPIDHSTGEAIFLFSAREVRSFPRSLWKLHATIDDGTRKHTALYTMDHTPWEELQHH